MPRSAAPQEKRARSGQVNRPVEKRRNAQRAESRRPIDRAEVAHLEALGARLAAQRIRGVLTVAGRVFDFARRRLGWAGQNPVRLLDRSERPRSDQRERRVLSGEELERLIAAADDAYRPIFAFAAGTGARLGETLGLRWRSLDLERGTASITHQLDRQRRYVELKTSRSRRTVELPASLVSLLRARKLEAPYSRDDDYVFSARTGGPLEHRNVAGRALHRAVDRAGLDQDGAQAPTFHALRHGFASAWIASGGDLVELSAHLGHRDPSITASTYSHEFEKATRSDARRARLDGMFGSALEAEATMPHAESSTGEVIAVGAGATHGHASQDGAAGGETRSRMALS